MELYQKRDFSTLLGDTFGFISDNFAHLLSNFLTISGVFIILSILNTYYFINKPVLDNPLHLLLLILILIGSIIMYSFIPIYLILYKNHKGTNFDYTDIIAFYKENAVKILSYSLTMLLLFIPLIIGFYIVLILITITVVGILLWPIAFAFLALVFALPLYEYLNTDKGIFESFGYAFSLIFKNFWATTSAVGILYSIIFILFYMGLIALGAFGGFVGIDIKDPDSINGAMQSYVAALSSPLSIVITNLVTILFYILGTVIGMVYFSQKEALENISSDNELDEIGTSAF